MDPSLILPELGNDSDKQRIKDMLDTVAKEVIAQNSLLPLATVALHLNGKPYSLKDYYYFHPLFDLQLPQKTTYMCCRQSGKSQNAAASAITRCVTKSNLNLIIVNPLFEMAKRFSTMRIQPLLHESPLYNTLFNASVGASDAIMQKRMTNNSMIYLTYAWLNLIRTRGLSGDILYYDEYQNLNYEFEPVINRILDESDIRLLFYFGTPLSSDNLLADSFMNSSSASEIAIRCSCGKWNIAHSEFDLLGMIKPQGPSCADKKCGKLLDLRKAVIIDRYPEKRNVHRGVHISRIVSIKTASDKRRWAELMRDITTLPKGTVYNEILGEPFDVGRKPITRAELEAACTLEVLDNSLEKLIELVGSYQVLAMGVDWSGGGADRISRTAVAFVGLKHTGVMDCLYGRIVPPMDPMQECHMLAKLFEKSHAQIFAHDAAVAGAVRHSILQSMGIASRVMPIVYEPNRPGKRLVQYKPPSGGRTLAYYATNKARSIATVCNLIKSKQLRFPPFPKISNCLLDFLSLNEEYVVPRDGAEIYYIAPSANTPDDWVHAVTFACLACWHSTDTLPTVEIDPKFFIDEEAWNSFAEKNAETAIDQLLA